MLLDDDYGLPVTFDVLKGKTFSSIIVNKPIRGDHSIEFHLVDSNKYYYMLHDQDCCESVTIEDICVDVNDLVGSPILVADETTNEGKDEDNETFTWTFYTLRTLKGTVTIRWYGTSNGYYSEGVDLYEARRD